MATPRMIWGHSIWAKSVSVVWKALIASPVANKAKPKPLRRRGSRRRSSATATGAAASWARPVANMIDPMARGPCPRTKARKTGIR